MKKFFAGCCVAAMVAIWAGVGWALTDTASHTVRITVDQVAMIALNEVTDINFTIGAPALAGQEFLVSPIDGDDSRWLWYTSIVAQQDGIRTITVQIDSATNIPAGIGLYVNPLANAIQGCGLLGVIVSGPHKLNTIGNNPFVIVNGIGSGYTGRDTANGVQLKYTLTVDQDCPSVGTLFAGTYNMLVTYTLTDSVVP